MLINFLNNLKNQFLLIAKYFRFNLFIDLFYFFILLDIMFNYNFFLIISNFLFFFIIQLNFISIFIFIFIIFLITNYNFFLNKFFYFFNIEYKFFNGNKQYNSLYLFFLYNLFILNNLFLNINYLINKCLFLFFNFYKTNLFFNFIFKCFFNAFKQINWYPIFKRHSIFGYYRISRQNWVELKTEEVNYIKY